jgi:exonuclease VII small subunit
VTDTTSLFGAISAAQKLTKDISLAKGRINAALDGQNAAAEALARTVEAIANGTRDFARERETFNRRVREQERRYERLEDAVRLYFSAVASTLQGDIEKAEGHLSRVLGGRAAPRNPAHYAREMLVALAKSESWGTMHLATGQAGTSTVVRDVITWQGGMERHPREGARLILLEMFDIDVDRAPTSFAERSSWEPREVEIEEEPLALPPASEEEGS